MNSPVVSIVIPAFNRPAPLRETLHSAAAAIAALNEPAELIVVDDGSEPPLAVALAAELAAASAEVIRQPNQGSIVARQTGLRAARGEFVLFLDSDDLVAPTKLREHVARLRSAGADIAYDDLAHLPQGSAPAAPPTRLPLVATVEELVLRVQPVPHGPIYRRDYLLNALTPPLLPPLRECDAVGDVWLYYNLAIHPARLVKVDAPLSLIGVHDEARYSQHWERLGFAALGVMEAFMQRCPVTPATEAARMIVGECAFNSWRRLPRGFAPAFSRRLLALWRAAPRPDRMQLGGPLFRTLSRIFGYVGAARLLRLRNAPYARIRTIDDAELNRLLAR